MSGKKKKLLELSNGGVHSAGMMSCLLCFEGGTGLLLEPHWRDGSATVSAPRYPTLWKPEETQMTPGLTYTAVQIIL